MATEKKIWKFYSILNLANFKLQWRLTLNKVVQLRNLEFQIPMTGLVIAIDAQWDPLEVENEFLYL